MLNVVRTHLPALLGSLLLLAACSGPREAAREPVDPLPEPAPVSLADYEDFDPRPYRDEAPADEEGIDHDVPENLMEGRATAGITRTVQGFRVQIANVPSKAEADAQLEDFLAWWRTQQGDGGGLFSQVDPPIYITYRQPNYRVRVGDFASRGQAEQALSSIRNQFPGAFIVPETVTITQ